MNAGKILKRVLLALLILFVIAAAKSLDIYKKAFSPNVVIPQSETFFYVRTGWNYDSILVSLKKQNLVKNVRSFEWTAKRKKLQNHIHPGKYLIKNRMSNNELVNKLRSGIQEPVKLTFNTIRTLDQFAGKIAQQLEIDSVAFLKHLLDSSVEAKYGLNKYTIACMFIPNTYEFYWNTDADKFLDRMYKEYQKFWNRVRIAQARQMNKTPEEIITLASIVNEETWRVDERKRIAGVYINRLEKGMRLQADPTIKYAVGNFALRRVLKKHYEVDSPYNTYMYAGLPPGPICFPDISSIEAVLNYEHHDYLYFCARPDFSGYHNFSKSLAEHSKNARAYQYQLNKKRIYK
jgi:UPF0755 protein